MYLNSKSKYPKTGIVVPNACTVADCVAGCYDGCYTGCDSSCYGNCATYCENYCAELCVGGLGQAPDLP